MNIPLTLNRRSLKNPARGNGCVFETKDYRMNPSKFPANRLVAGVGLLLSIALNGSMHGQTIQGRAEVTAVKGSAVYVVPGGQPAPVTVGAVLPPGTSVKTDAKSVVDVFLGKTAGTLRITEQSTLILDKFNLTDTGADTVVEVQLNIAEGTASGRVKKLPGGSKYEIKVPNGVAGIRGTWWVMNAQSELILLEGRLAFVVMKADGTLTPVTMSAPPPKSFTPQTGVTLATPQQITSAQQQSPPPGSTPPPGGGNVTPPSQVKEPYVSPGTGKKQKTKTPTPPRNT